MKSLAQKWRAFGDDSGSIAIVFAAAAFFVVLAIGIAIDSARAYNVSTRVSAALDSAALAAAKLLDDPDVSDDDIEDRARRFFAVHFSSAPVTGLNLGEPDISVDRDQGEVSIAVNVSVNTTFGQLAGLRSFSFPREAKVRYNQKKIELAAVLDITGSMCSPCTKIDGLKSAARTLVANIITPQTPYGWVRVALVPFSAAVNAGPYAGAVSGGASTDGCVVERSGNQNDTDNPPNGSNALGVSDRGTNHNYACPSPVLTPLTADAAALTTQIDALAANGSTAGHIGLAWGWYTISHKWNSIWPADSKPKPPNNKLIKAVLLMTDGEFNTSYIPGPGMNSTSVNTADSSSEQASRLCDQMKADGIVVYTVGFQAPAEALNLLSRCASSPQNFFATGSNTELVAAFRTIAERLSTLRLSQ